MANTEGKPERLEPAKNVEAKVFLLSSDCLLFRFGGLVLIVSVYYNGNSEEDAHKSHDEEIASEVNERVAGGQRKVSIDRLLFERVVGNVLLGWSGFFLHRRGPGLDWLFIDGQGSIWT